MELVCTQCSSKLKIPDEKIPKKQTARVSCPKCKNELILNPVETSQHQEPEDYSLDSIPFEFLEQGAKTALVCEDDEHYTAQISSALKNIGYHITSVLSNHDALMKMKFHVYDIVVVNHIFENSPPESNYVLRYLNSLPMAIRRDIFVVLIGKTFRTLDRMASFAKSVNIVVSPDNLDQFEMILKKSLFEHQEFYRIFQEVLKARELR
ncbi:MAG: hypothetical protein V1753_04660 [Pseudomonadota bacterium]